MARHVFFSFHYQRDIFRVNIVRMSNVVRPSDSSKTYHDSSLWEEAKKKGEAPIKAMINDALAGTTVTCVLIGAKTAERDYVRYEIQRSREIGNGILAVHIHNIKDAVTGRTDRPGTSPFGFFDHFNGICTYDWIGDSGRNYFGDWVETAYRSSPKAKRDAEIKRRASGSIW